MAAIQYQIPVTRSEYLQAFIDEFVKNGLDESQLLESSDLPLDLAYNQQGFVPTLSLNRLIYLAADELGVDQTIQSLRDVFRTKAVPSVLHLFASFSTVREALEETAEIFSKDSPGSRVFFRNEHDKHWFCRAAFNDSVTSTAWHWHEPFVICYVIELIQALTNKLWSPTEIKVQVTEVSILTEILGSDCKISIGNQDTSIYLPNEILDTPLALSERQLNPASTFDDWHTTFADSVFELLENYSREQSFTLDKAAKILGYSSRTFQRKLKEEQTSFKQIRDSVIYSQACRLMTQGHSLTYISSQLGYQNISHFSRSFKRISGMTPKAYLKASI